MNPAVHAFGQKLAGETYLGGSPGEAHYVRGSACRCSIRGEPRGVTVVGPFRGAEVRDLQTKRENEQMSRCLSQRTIKLDENINETRAMGVG